ncbi:MAG: hypothetical protein M1837_004747 [Sclerophora amabilis]|nr:MAG: hypothetical protein M1837_004747 [Sclerophora amabilis]
MDNKVRFPPTSGWRDVISAGNVDVVLALDAVVKIPLKEQDQHYIDIEKQVAYLMALYDNITQWKGARSATLQMRWIRQVVELAVFIHSKGILHGDISCNNIFLDHDLNAKMGDFAGSSIDGIDSLVCYETRYDHPSTLNITVKSEIFALGALIYEILTGYPPYQDLSEAAVEDAYDREEYPDLGPVSMFKDVIAKCWKRQYASADELLLDVEVQSKKIDPSSGSYIIEPSQSQTSLIKCPRPPLMLLYVLSRSPALRDISQFCSSSFLLSLI